MAGSSNITGDESIIFCDNMSFDGTERGGKMTTDGQLWIGSSASPHVKLGTIASQTGLFTVGYSNPNILFNVNSSYISVLATGLQLKGNNTNTAPPAGFIGEQISSYQSGIGFSNTIAANITSINVTAGIWDISAIATGINTGTALQLARIGISTNTGSFTGCNEGDSEATTANGSATFNTLNVSIPSFRVSLASTTTYYLVGQVNFTGGTNTMNGRISATRVG